MDIRCGAWDGEIYTEVEFCCDDFASSIVRILQSLPQLVCKGGCKGPGEG
jgi:hypothetical protein